MTGNVFCEVAFPFLSSSTVSCAVRTCFSATCVVMTSDFNASAETEGFCWRRVRSSSSLVASCFWLTRLLLESSLFCRSQLRCVRDRHSTRSDRVTSLRWRRRVLNAQFCNVTSRRVVVVVDARVACEQTCLNPGSTVFELTHALSATKVRLCLVASSGVT